MRGRNDGYSLGVLGLLSLAACGSPEEAPRVFPAVEALPVVAQAPDPLAYFFSQGAVESADDWHTRRRPELLDLFSHYVYGYSPARTESTQVELTRGTLFEGSARFVELQLTYHPQARPIVLLIVHPSATADGGLAPVLLGLNKCGNHSIMTEPGPAVSQSWVHPDCPEATGGRSSEAARGSRQSLWPVRAVVERGYALATFHESDVDPDEPIDPRTDDGAQLHLPSGAVPDLAWGTIAVWAYGLSLALDGLIADGSVDATRIAVLGHSRRGKAALLAAARDQRFWLAAPHQSGTGGAALSRSKNGESVGIINALFPHWFGAKFQEFADQEQRLPIDQHLLISLVAPRPVLVSDGSEDDWADPAGAQAAVEAASQVYELLGVPGLVPEGLNRASFSGHVAWHRRPGGHALQAGDWTTFMDFGDQHR